MDATASATGFSRVPVALMLRELKSLWELSRDVALVEDLVASTSAEQEQLVRAKYDKFGDEVVAHGLVGVWDLKPLLNVRGVPCVCDLSGWSLEKVVGRADRWFAVVVCRATRW